MAWCGTAFGGAAIKSISASNLPSAYTPTHALNKISDGKLNSSSSAVRLANDQSFRFDFAGQYRVRCWLCMSLSSGFSFLFHFGYYKCRRYFHLFDLFGAVVGIDADITHNSHVRTFTSCIEHEKKQRQHRLHSVAVRSWNQPKCDDRKYYTQYELRPHQGNCQHQQQQNKCTFRHRTVACNANASDREQFIPNKNERTGGEKHANDSRKQAEAVNTFKVWYYGGGNWTHCIIMYNTFRFYQVFPIQNPHTHTHTNSRERSGCDGNDDDDANKPKRMCGDTSSNVWEFSTFLYFF